MSDLVQTQRLITLNDAVAVMARPTYSSIFNFKLIPAQMNAVVRRKIVSLTEASAMQVLDELAKSPDTASKTENLHAKAIETVQLYSPDFVDVYFDRNIRQDATLEEINKIHMEQINQMIIAWDKNAFLGYEGANGNLVNAGAFTNSNSKDIGDTAVGSDVLTAFTDAITGLIEQVANDAVVDQSRIVVGFTGANMKKALNRPIGDDKSISLRASLTATFSSNLIPMGSRFMAEIPSVIVGEDRIFAYAVDKVSLNSILPSPYIAGTEVKALEHKETTLYTSASNTVMVDVNGAFAYSNVTGL